MLGESMRNTQIQYHNEKYSDMTFFKNHSFLRETKLHPDICKTLVGI